nr:hypothetical protein [Actinopolymorpha rutila]
MGKARRTSRDRVLIISGSVGAGHDGAAEELRRRLMQLGLDVECRDFLDALPRWMRFVLRSGYAASVTHAPRFYDWLFTSIERTGPVRWLCLLLPRLATRTVARWCTDAASVVSTYPLASQCVGLLVKRGALDVPTVTYLTDPAVHRLWVCEYIDRHLTVLPATAEQGELAYGIPMTAAGPLVPDRFGTPLPEHRRAELRAELGIDPERPLAIVVAGSLGMGRVPETVDALVATGRVVPLVLCGRNHHLRRTLQRRPGVLALGWRDDVHELMGLGNVLVHNAGGLSFTESLVAGLPAVTFACITGHGQANGDVLARYGIAPRAETFEDLCAALDRQLSPGASTRLRESLADSGDDAASVVVTDLHEGRLRAGRMPATEPSAASATRRPKVPRRSRRWRVAAVALMTTAMVTLGTTRGVDAATRHGFAVATLAPGSVAIAVEGVAPHRLTSFTSALRNAAAAVVVPTKGWTPADVRAARELTAAGVTLVTEPCDEVAMLSQPSSCDAGRIRRELSHRHIAVAPLMLSVGSIDPDDLVLAAVNATKLLRVTRVVPLRAAAATPTSPVGSAHSAAGPGSVVLIDDRAAPPHALPAELATLRRACTARGLRVVSVATARAER